MTATSPVVSSPPLVHHLRRRGGADALLCGDQVISHADLADRVEKVAATYVGARRLVLLAPHNDIDSVVHHLAALAADQVVLIAPASSLETITATYDPDVVVTDGQQHWRRHDSAHDLHPDLSLLLSTSGSTGSPKLVRLSREGLLVNAEAIAESLGIRNDDVAGLTLPLHYCYGLSVLHSHLLRGAAVRLDDASVTDDSFWERAADITTLAGVPHTYDLLERSGFADRRLPRLRYLTQAGGRLAPDAVRRWAELGRERGWDFVVMYGQTEATARLAVLPADRALDAPEAIGLPVAGVEFSLIDADHPDPEVGELVAQGPSVMLGYAISPADLALGRTTERLHTGDLARRRDDGLWQIVGRSARFAKVCGLRIDLDHLEQRMAVEGVVAAAADGGDRVVVGVCDGARPVDPDQVRSIAAGAAQLPAGAIGVVTLEALPRTERGKVDYPALLRANEARSAAEDESRTSGRTVTPAAVTALIGGLLGRPDARPTDTFVGLGGDSLSYVEASLRLERLLGDLPAGWPTTPLAALADVSGSPRRWGAAVETNVVMRALAILTVVGTHANVFTLLGGAHLLVAIAGFNLARFQLTDVPRRVRARNILTAAARVAVPSMLVIGVFSVWGLWAEGLTWRQVLLVNGLTSASWSEPGWYFWFIEALVHTLLLLAVLLAIPAVDRWERARPFLFPMALVLVAMLTRYDVINVRGDAEHRAHVVFWLFALGWAAAKAVNGRQRLLVSLVAVGTLIGAFDQIHRDVYVGLGILALVWVPSVRLPRLLVRLVGMVAAASLWIYLTHWQVYPRWEDSQPLLAMTLSVVVGIACAAVGGWVATRAAVVRTRLRGNS